VKGKERRTLEGRAKKVSLVATRPGKKVKSKTERGGTQFSGNYNIASRTDRIVARKGGRIICGVKSRGRMFRNGEPKQP